jgi:hypothetical protein
MNGRGGVFVQFCIHRPEQSFAERVPPAFE